MQLTPILRVQDELVGLLDLSKARPYVFRTRLERVLEKLFSLSSIESRNDIQNKCIKLKEKLNYISDQSNQSSDGTLKSFLYLKDDIVNLSELLKS